MGGLHRRARGLGGRLPELGGGALLLQPFDLERQALLLEGEFPRLGGPRLGGHGLLGRV